MLAGGLFFETIHFSSLFNMLKYSMSDFVAIFYTRMKV